MAKTDITQKGHGFEKKVATWAKKFFKASEVKPDVWFQGKAAVRPYNIDVWVKRKGGWLENYLRPRRLAALQLSSPIKLAL